MKQLPERLKSKIEFGPGCWEWQAGKQSDGYGWFKDGRMRLAHRVVYELLVGPVPAGHELDHLCRNRGCVNPAHLDVVTRQEHARRGGNAAKTHCVHGHLFDAKNTYVRPGGGRDCRACFRERARRYRQKRR